MNRLNRLIKKFSVQHAKSEKSDMIAVLKNNAFLTGIFILFISVSLQGQVRFTANISSDVVEVNQPFELVYRIENGETEDLQIPTVQGLTIAKRAGITTNFTIINGKSSGYMEYTYPVIAEKTGNYTIPPAKVVIKGKTIYSNAIQIKVVKSAGMAMPEAGGEVFFKAKLTRDKIYLGQQTCLQYDIYTSKNVINANFEKRPVFQHLFSKPLDLRHTGKNVVIDKKNYYTQTIESLALYAQKSGKHFLEPANIIYKYEVPDERNPFFNEVVTKNLTTNSLYLEVSELPTENVPVSFSGGVGDFSFSAKVIQQTITTNDVLKLSMTIKGDGDPKFWKYPHWEKMDDVEFYEPNLISEKTELEKGREYTTRVYEYLIQVSKPKDFVLQPEFSYFDPDKQAYVTLEDKPVIVKVVQGKTNSEQAEMDSAKPHVKTNEVKPLILFLAGIVLILLVSAGYRYKKKRNAAHTKTTHPDSRDTLASLFEKARLHEEKNENKLFFEAISSALNTYCKNRFNLQNEDVSKDRMIELFKEKNIPDSLISTFCKIYGDCEIALFAGQKPNMKDIVTETMSWVNGMDRLEK